MVLAYAVQKLLGIVATHLLAVNFGLLIGHGFVVHQIHNIVQIFGDDLLTIGLLVAVLRHIQNLLNDFDLVSTKRTDSMR